MKEVDTTHSILTYYLVILILNGKSDGLIEDAVGRDHMANP
jgi:hypothetical protein